MYISSNTFNLINLVLEEVDLGLYEESRSLVSQIQYVSKKIDPFFKTKPQQSQKDHNKISTVLLCFEHGMLLLIV